MLHSPVQPFWPGTHTVRYRGSLMGREGAEQAQLQPWPASQLLLYDASWRAVLTVEGPAARPWLNGMISANVRDLAPGQVAPSFQLDPKGHILATLDVACTGADSFLLLSDEAQQAELEQRLRRFVFISKLTLENRSEAWAALRLRGPRAPEAARRIGLEAAAPGHIEAAGDGWTMAAAPGGVDQVEIMAPGNAVGEIWERLRGVATPAGSVCQERDRILSRQPLYGTDITAAELPQETGQQERLSFSKGCYIGQEIVERIRARGAVHRHWSAFAFAAPVEAGTELVVGGRALGTLTSVTADGEGWFALGYIRDPQPGQTVSAAGVAGRLLA